jgi:hypothetical protein
MYTTVDPELLPSHVDHDGKRPDSSINMSGKRLPAGERRRFRSGVMCYVPSDYLSPTKERTLPKSTSDAAFLVAQQGRSLHLGQPRGPFSNSTSR